MSKKDKLGFGEAEKAPEEKAPKEEKKVEAPKAEAKPKEEPKKEEPKASEEVTAPTAVPYRVFRTLSGVKPDKLAGFDHHVKREKLGPMPIPEWKDALAAFLNKPVKSLRRK